MLERSVPVLRILCLVLGGVVLLQLATLAFHRDPLTGVKVPAALTAAKASEPPAHPPGTNVVATPGPPAQSANLPPAIQARVDRIVQSEILGPVIRPPPMALLGIAGPDAFLRGPNGQTGLLREGEELGGVKLLKIGTNRVLIEHEGKKKELTIFSGFGSETLLPKAKESSQ